MNTTLSGKTTGNYTRKGWYLTGNFGAGISKMTNTNMGNYGYTFTNKTYYGGTIGGGYMFSDHAGIFAGISRDYHSIYYANGYFNNGKETSLSQSFISIPISLSLVTNKHHQPSFYTDAGLKLWFMTNVKDEYPMGTSTEKDGYRETGFSGTLNIGVLIPVNKYLDLKAGPDLQYSFLSVFETSRMKGNLLSIGGRLSVVYKLTK